MSIKSNICTKCGKEVDVFPKKGRRRCIKCISEYNKEYGKGYRIKHREKLNKQKKEIYNRNRSKYLEQSKKYREKNREKLLEYEKNRRDDPIRRERQKKYSAKYYEENKSKIKERVKTRHMEQYKNNELFRIISLTRSHLRSALKKQGLTKSKRLREYGIDPVTIYKCIGDRPTSDHHLEHILPVTAFDMTDTFHIYACWHPDNLRWLPSAENLSKGKEYNQKDFDEYIEQFK